MTEQVQLVIVGFGAAAAAAALTAADLGANTVILEKQAAQRHTPSSRMSGGLVMGVNDADLGRRYLARCADGMIPEALCDVWARSATTLKPWYEAHTRDIYLNQVGGAENLDFEGAEAIEVFRPAAERRSEHLDVTLTFGERTVLIDAIAGRADIDSGGPVIVANRRLAGGANRAHCPAGLLDAAHRRAMRALCFDFHPCLRAVQRCY